MKYVCFLLLQKQRKNHKLVTLFKTLKTTKKQTHNVTSSFIDLVFIFITVTVKDGVEIEIADRNGKTPLMLAHGRKHEEVCDYLQRQLKKKKSILPKIDF